MEENKLCHLLEMMHKEIKRLSLTAQAKTLFNNKEIKEYLDINDKLLKKYRDDGLLAYTQVGDKYWYQRSDIEQFINSNRVESFASVQPA